MRAYLKITFALLLIVLHGCISSTLPQFSKEIDQPEASFILYVSNQSFDKPKVDISIKIDGDLIVEDLFRVKNQHYWKIYALKLPTGHHLLEAKANNGAYEYETSIKITEKHWAVLSFWYKDEPDETSTPSGFTFEISDEPFYFL